MRIGIVVNSAWNIYNFRLGLVRSLLNSKYKVVAIAPDDGYASKLKQEGCEFYHLDIDSKGTNPLNDFNLTKNLVKIYKKAKLDAVLHYTIKPNIYGSIAAKIAGIPSINNVTGLGTVFIHDNFSSKVAHWLYKISFQFPQTVFFQNEDDRSLFLQKKLVNKNITDVLPGSGIDIQRFQPQGHRSRNPKFTFLMVARMLYDKGVIEYINAVRILQKQGVNARFCMLGKIETDRNLGIPPQQIEQWEKEGIIEYLGTTEDVRPFIEQSDCMILPSYREGTPRTLIEAASMGKPIVTTDVPGCRETVEDEQNGFLCEVRNPIDLAEKMRQMLEADEQKLQRMGKHSRELALRKFDQNIVIRKYQSAISSLKPDHISTQYLPAPVSVRV